MNLYYNINERWEDTMEERHSKERIPEFEIYTDGSLKKRGKFDTFGAWGFIVVRDSIQIYDASGGEYQTTNQRMELRAIVEALKYAQANRRGNERVTIYSDSAYAINCYEKEWYINWINNGWINSKKESVANQDLWMDIIPFFDNFWYTFKKVKGHGDSFWNNKCDVMVQNCSEQMKRTWRGIDNGIK